MKQSFRFKPAELGIFNSKDSDSALSTFGTGCRIIGLTNGQFSLIDLIHSALKKTGPAHVVACTWSAGIKDVHQIAWLIDSELIKSFTIVTDHSFATRQKKYALSIEELFGAENIRTTEVHAKFVIISNERFKVAIRTSMNLNANRTCETFEIDEDTEIWQFYKNFLDHTFADMPIGFTSSSWKASQSLRKYFTSTQTEEKYNTWSDL